MGKEQVLGLVRHVLTAAGGGLVAKGMVDAGTLDIAAGAVAALVGVAWSILAKRKAAA